MKRDSQATHSSLRDTHVPPPALLSLSMSFARRVFDAATASQAAQIAEARDCAICAFKHSCICAAKAGAFSAEVTVCVLPYFSDTMRNTMSSVLFASLLKDIEGHILLLGFTTFKVQPYDKAYLTPADRDYMKISMTATWKVEPKSTKLGSNVTSRCPVCFEMRESVAFIPCGHLICLTCEPNFTNNQSPEEQKCPTCRQHITGAQSLYGS